MFNSRDSENEINTKGKYYIPYYVGECLENKDNSEELIKIWGYFIDRNGIMVYINRNIYRNGIMVYNNRNINSTKIEDCEIISLEELTSSWIKTSRITITTIPNQSKTNIGLSKMFEESCGRLEVTDKGVTLVKKQSNSNLKR